MLALLSFLPLQTLSGRSLSTSAYDATSQELARTSENSVKAKFVNKTLGTGPERPGRAGGRSAVERYYIPDKMG
jgi:hypothetical protein